MDNKVRICISAYLNTSQRRVDGLYTCVYSFLSQTYQNFEIFIHHDGPLNDSSLADKFRQISDKITFIDDLEHKGHWGFYHRHNVSLIEPCSEWVLYTNEDNYYVPTFLETMINKAINSDSKMVYCNCLHNDYNYSVLDTRVAQNYIDMGSFISHIDLVKTTPWTDFTGNADGIYAEKIAAKTTPVKINEVLFVHN